MTVRRSSKEEWTGRASLLLLLALSVASRVGASEWSEAVDPLVEAAMKQDHIPAISVGVERRGEVLLAKGYGFADLENRVPATEHTVYRIGSVTKQFTAAAVLLLAERGAVGLDDDIRLYLPDYDTHGRRILVRQLLNHTCGIKGYTEIPAFWQQSREDLSPARLMELFAEPPLEFEPGDRWQYSNSGYYLLGQIIEKASGWTYEDFLRDEIFRPLGLDESWYLDNAPIVPNRAEGYEVRDGRVVNDEPLSMRLPFSAGSLGASVHDLLAWRRALSGGRVITAASLAQMTTPGRLNDGKPLTYGFGLSIGAMQGHRKISHGGGINGFRAQLSWYPDDDLTVVVLANTGSASPDVLESAIARALLGIPEREIHEVSLAEEELKRYAGLYDPGRSPIPVVLKEGALWLFGARRLIPLGGDAFVAEDDVYRDVRFEMRDGRAVSLRMEREGQVTEAARVE